MKLLFYGGAYRQYLPDALFCVVEKIHELMGACTQVTDTETSG